MRFTATLAASLALIAATSVVGMPTPNSHPSIDKSFNPPSVKHPSINHPSVSHPAPVYDPTSPVHCAYNSDGTLDTASVQGCPFNRPNDDDQNDEPQHVCKVKSASGKIINVTALNCSKINVLSKADQHKQACRTASASGNAVELKALNCANVNVLSKTKTDKRDHPSTHPIQGNSGKHIKCHAPVFNKHAVVHCAYNHDGTLRVASVQGCPITKPRKGDHHQPMQTCKVKSAGGKVIDVTALNCSDIEILSSKTDKRDYHHHPNSHPKTSDEADQEQCESRSGPFQFINVNALNCSQVDVLSNSSPSKRSPQSDDEGCQTKSGLLKFIDANALNCSNVGVGSKSTPASKRSHPKMSDQEACQTRSGMFKFINADVLNCSNVNVLSTDGTTA